MICDLMYKCNILYSKNAIRNIGDTKKGLSLFLLILYIFDFLYQL